MQRCEKPACGHLNRPSARFCEKCGQALRTRPWEALRSGHVMREGAYRILEPLGKGGMGALYLAADTGAFDRRCVVKELLDYYDPTDPDEALKAQKRFETEARLLAELSHPGIPRIYSYFSEAGRHYIVMEYIEGETLERAVTHTDPLGRTVAARALDPEEVVRHAIRICRVLEYLASRATPVIHHDIKPANLVVDQTSGEVRLVDFGTAQIRTRWATQARLGQGAPSIFGTQGYAAPEQHQSRSEPRSDVYGLAATVYHLLTDDDPGDHPFQFPQLATLPSPLADALARALRVEVHRRSTALEFRHALEAWLIPEEAALPYVFRSGAVAHTTEELVALCDQHWSEARQHLVAGDFDRWFRDRNRHDLVAKARSAKLEPNEDAALEMFLRRVNPRLPPPRLSIQPLALDFGLVTRGVPISRILTLHNEGRGYGQASLTASVPWLHLDHDQLGCMSGTEVPVEVRIDGRALSLRQEHQALITCTPTQGPPISVSVTVRLNLFKEIVRLMALSLRTALRLIQCSARRGLGLWMQAVRSLLRSRYGRWLLVGETLLLDVVMVALWWNWFLPSPDLLGLIRTFVWTLPLALLAAFGLPALGFIAAALAHQTLRKLRQRSEPSWR